jgi:aspartyl-tRNA(Asn)/glutamyl-tRNA(Gln) amidotransferase subunit A
MSLADLSLVEAADAVAAGEVTSRALVEAALARIDKLNGQLNAVIWVDRDAALAAADAADKAQASGAALGPLHGVPLMHKDMFDDAGRRATAGSKIRAAHVGTRPATVIERLAAAGGLTIGGLNMAEFAHNPTGHNSQFGDCRNPWDRDKVAGGSSSGSGAAVAARMIFGSIGSDTGGSIRMPASMCGVTGLKPTQTRVSRAGVMPLSFSADCLGPLARTARDCARLLGVIAGADARDPTAANEPVPDYEAALDGDLKGQRIAVPENYFLDGVDDEVVAAFEKSLEVLVGRGATIVRLKVPLLAAINAYASVLSRVEAGAAHAAWMRARPADYGLHVSARLYPTYAIPAAYYIEALSRRGPLLRRFVDEVFGAADILVSPTVRNAVATLAETDVDVGPPGSDKKFFGMSANTKPFSYLGVPSASVGCGYDGAGMPIGLQITGRPFGEARILRVADAFQRDTEWHRRVPPLVTAA